MPESMESKRRIYLALDVGDVRVGVAISRSGVIAEPLETVERRDEEKALDRIRELATTNRVTECVVGLPRLESGVEGVQAAKTREFCGRLAGRLPGVEMVLWDERYTTSEARSIAGKRAGGGQNRGLVDRIAAAIILQEYLDRQQKSL